MVVPVMFQVLTAPLSLDRCGRCAIDGDGASLWLCNKYNVCPVSDIVIVFTPYFSAAARPAFTTNRRQYGSSLFNRLRYTILIAY